MNMQTPKQPNGSRYKTTSTKHTTKERTQAIGPSAIADLAFEQQQQQNANQSIRMHLPYWFSFVKLLFYKFAYFVLFGFTLFKAGFYRDVAIAAIVL